VHSAGRCQRELDDPRQGRTRDDHDAPTSVIAQSEQRPQTGNVDKLDTPQVKVDAIGAETQNTLHRPFQQRRCQ
jgi:hypothetical protein